MYKVNEIFYSLQGEGRWMGRPAVFVRMSGCNLKCPFCDTDFRGYSEMSADDILSRCLEEGGECRFIVLTGGEPSLQVDEQLISTLHQAGYYLSMETNGTHAIPEGIDWVTCSPKVDFTEGGEPVVKQVDELKLIFDGEHQISDHGIAYLGYLHEEGLCRPIAGLQSYREVRYASRLQPMLSCGQRRRAGHL